MDEQIKEVVENTVVETGLEKAADMTTENAQKALETVSSEPQIDWGVKNALIGAGIGLIFGGAAIGYAADRWVIPWFQKKIDAAKTKRAQKKAEKAAKKAAKQAGQKENTQTPEALAADPKFDPMTVTTEIDNV